MEQVFQENFQLNMFIKIAFVSQIKGNLFSADCVLLSHLDNETSYRRKQTEATLANLTWLIRQARGQILDLQSTPTGIANNVQKSKQQFSSLGSMQQCQIF